MNRETERLAEGFWRAAGITPRYPIDVERAACWALPLGVVHVPELSTQSLAGWISPQPIRSRPLHGALLARRGRGLIFVDGRDPGNERRFSIAHECAHFIIDYHAPREHALRILGKGVLGVLDGDRTPTARERVESLLAEVPLGLLTHLLAGDLHRRSGEQTYCTEWRADALAFELLAPAREVMARARHRPKPDELQALLVRHFGLPAGPAAVYGRLLAPPVEPSVREWLGLTAVELRRPGGNGD